MWNTSSLAGSPLMQSSSKTNQHFRAGPARGGLDLGTDNDVEARIVYCLLERYGLLDCRARIMLRDLDCELGGAPETMQPTDGSLRCGAWRLLFPAYPIEIYSLRVGPRILETFRKLATSDWERVTRCHRSLSHHVARICEVQNLGKQDPPLVAIVVSDGRGPAAEMATIGSSLVRDGLEVMPLREMLRRIDDIWPRELWMQRAARPGWNAPYARRTSGQFDDGGGR